MFYDMSNFIDSIRKKLRIYASFQLLLEAKLHINYMNSKF